ncbi:MAG TPA: hypothetical protein VMB21_01115 [Candidatus Limnocylindria bacterium]|nr:hypothetical protein [Candidatus Limnocylindria bacterium]
MRRSTANAIHVSTVLLLTFSLIAVDLLASVITVFASFGFGICGGPEMPLWQILVFMLPVAAALSTLTAKFTFRPLWWLGAFILNGPLTFLSFDALFETGFDASDLGRAIVTGVIMPLISLAAAYRIWKRRCREDSLSHIQIKYDPVEPLAYDEWPNLEE